MEIDEEGLIDFIEESQDSFDTLDISFVELEKEGSDKEELDKIFRAVHTIKGSASFLGFTRLQKLSHSAENILDMARSGELTLSSDHITLLLKSIDALRYFVREIEKNRQEPENDFQPIIDALQAAAELKDFSPDQLNIAELSGEEPGSKKESETLESAEVSEPEVIEVPAEKEEDDWDEVADEQDDWHKKPKLPVLQHHKKEPLTKPETHSKKVSAGSVRVDVELLDKLMNLVGELVLSRNQLIQLTGRNADGELSSVSNHLSFITSELQAGIMRTRMQPISGILGTYMRVVRDLSHQMGKEVDLDIEGGSTELDRSVLESIKDPLTHIIRNSIDHGVENPETREKAGKDPKGRILINSFQKDGQVVIEISDDGAGLDRNKMAKKIAEKGLASKDALEQMKDSDIFNFIFMPGFSTAKNVTDISGRGVGLDVVKTNIHGIGGQVEIKSELGEGCTFTLKIPLTLAIVPALVVKTGGSHYCIPQLSLRELILLDPNQENKIENFKGMEVFRLRGKLIPVVRLSRTLGFTESDKKEVLYLIILAHGEKNYGVIVDEVEDSREIVVKPLGGHFKESKIFAGASIMGDGEISLILDVAGLATLSGIHQQDAHSKASHSVYRTKTSHTVLLFSLGGPELFGIQMSQVQRLELVKKSSIELAGSREVIQYRGGILPLVRLSKYMGIEENLDLDEIFLIVFKIQEREVGLMARKIVDSKPLSGELQTHVINHPLALGTMELEGDVVILLDAFKIFEQDFGSWFKARGFLGEGDRPKKILFVDDSAFYRKVIKRYLEDAGLSIQTAEDGQDGLDKAKAGEYDLFIIDLEMPVMNGAEMIRNIRESSQWDHVPILVLSALTDGEERENALSTGVQSYLVKLNKEDLMNEVDRLLKLSEAKA